MKTKPGLLFSYYGSKWNQAPLLTYPSCRTFVDVFGGTGAFLGRRQPGGIEIYNDKDPTVVNVFSMIKDPVACKQILTWLDGMEKSHDQYDSCKKILKDSTESNVRKAWAFLACGVIGYVGHPLITGWSSQSTRTFVGLSEKIRWWHERLKKVRIENLRWQDAIEKFDSPQSLFVVDPPYMPEVMTSSPDNYYRSVMTAADHVELIERLRGIQGYAVLCGYNHPLYTRLLFHWRKIMIPRKTSHGKRIECVWHNYENDGAHTERVRLLIAKRFLSIIGGEQEAEKLFKRIRRLMRLPP